jgi:hypothetical protein
VIAHPWLEQVVQQLLRTTDVQLFWGVAPHARWPSLDPPVSVAEQWAQGSHTDTQATVSDWEATPRRTRVELWHWLSDVPADRGAMRVLPGSHLPIMKAWDRVCACAPHALLGRLCVLCDPWVVMFHLRCSRPSIRLCCRGSTAFGRRSAPKETVAWRRLLGPSACLRHRRDRSRGRSRRPCR